MDRLEAIYKQHKEVIESEYFSEQIKTFSNCKLISLKTKYLESKQLKKDLIPIIDKAKKILIVADTGIGKTHAILNIFANDPGNHSIAFLLPNTANVQQIEKEYNHLYIQALYENSDPFYQDNGLVVSTWDSIRKVHDKSQFKIVIQDEIHSQTQSMDYRPNAVNLAQKIDNDSIITIDITATPKGLNLSSYDYIIQYQKEKTQDINVKVNLYSYKKDIVSSAIYENIKKNKDGKFLILKQDKDFLINFIKHVNKNTNKNGVFLSANNKYENTVYKEILEKRLIGIDVIGHTNIFATGININNEENIHLYLINIKDSITIKQYIARFRKAKSITVHIFNNFKSSENNLDSYSKILQDVNSKSQTILKLFNNTNLKQEIQSNIYKDIDKSLGIEYDNKKQKYISNNIKLQYISYKNYTHQFDQIDLKFSLLEYFKNIKIRDDLNNKVTQDLIKVDKISKDLKDNTYKALYNDTLQNLIEYDKNIVNIYKYNLKKYNNFHKSSILKTLNNKSINDYLKAYINLNIIKNKIVNKNIFEYKFMIFIQRNIKFNKVYTNFELEKILKEYNKENNLNLKIKSLNEKLKKYYHKNKLKDIKQKKNNTYYYKFQKISRKLLTNIINQNKKINELNFNFSKNDIDKIINADKEKLKIKKVN